MMNEEASKAINAALKGWEISEAGDTISAYKETVDESTGRITSKHLYIYTRLSFDDSKPQKYVVKFGGWERFRYSDNFFNKRSYTVQRSGDLKKTVARLQAIA
jgi:hypothetical protein